MPIEDTFDRTERGQWINILEKQLLADGERTARKTAVIEIKPFQNDDLFYFSF